MPAAVTAPAVDAVLALAEDEQEAVFLALVRKLIAVHGECRLIPVGTETESLGYFVPPAAADAIYRARGPQLTAEEEAEFRRRVRDPGEVMTAEEAITRLKAEVAERRRIPA